MTFYSCVHVYMRKEEKEYFPSLNLMGPFSLLKYYKKK